MTQRAELLKEIDVLQPEYFGEVLDFVVCLRQKARLETVPIDSRAQVITSEKWVNPLFGLAKAKGATLTLERFMEMQQEEIERENENDRRLWGNLTRASL